MHLARRAVDGPDGLQARILASNDPAQGWADVRTHIRHAHERRGATKEGATRLAEALAPGSMSAALAAGEAFLEAARAAAEDGERVQGEIRFLSALDPSGYRDFMTFERHFSFGYKWQGKPVPEIMYELPVSYFGNPLSFVGPDDLVPWPHYTQRMDYELELGIVIGKPGSNLTPEEAIGHIVGYTILNDFSARDIQAREMTGGLGPSKGKHFACGAGPYLTTPDSLEPAGLRMQARVNGQTWCDANSNEMIWTPAEIVAWASQGEQLVPGMLLGSGTCNGGSSIEIQREIQPGDVLELEIAGLGVLRNRFGQPAAEGWWPQARRR